MGLWGWHAGVVEQGMCSGGQRCWRAPIHDGALCPLINCPPCPLPVFLSLKQKNGYTPGVNLFGAGYDFRQSCRLSGRALLARLQVWGGCAAAAAEV